MSLRIETPRLLIREIGLKDSDALFSMDSDPEVHRYLGNRPYTDMQQTLDNIAFSTGNTPTMESGAGP